MSQTCEAAQIDLATKRIVPPTTTSQQQPVFLAFWPYLSLGSLSVGVVGRQSCGEGHCTLYLLIAGVCGK